MGGEFRVSLTGKLLTIFPGNLLVNQQSGGGIETVVQQLHFAEKQVAVIRLALFKPDIRVQQFQQFVRELFNNALEIGLSLLGRKHLQLQCIHRDMLIPEIVTITWIYSGSLSTGCRCAIL